jgi:hypothetical protein
LFPNWTTQTQNWMLPLPGSAHWSQLWSLLLLTPSSSCWSSSKPSLPRQPWPLLPQSAALLPQRQPPTQPPQPSLPPPLLPAAAAGASRRLLLLLLLLLLVAAMDCLLQTPWQSSLQI